jgi:outer membrane protein assembly factor BamB
MELLRADDPAGVGPYRLLRRLGARATGQVFLGCDSDGWLAAIKVLHDGYTADATERARFAGEVATTRAVHAPWTPAVLDADTEAPMPWLATEYVFGPTLESVAALPERAVGALAVRLARALAELHKMGLVHGNVTPSNVLLGADGPKLIDFGEARTPDATGVTRTGTVRGEPGFISPEQVAGAVAGPACDVFSLAAVLVRAATGRGPFGRTASPLAMLRRVADEKPDLAEVPERLRRILTPCLAKQPDQRPAAAALADSLADYADVSWPPPAITEAIRTDLEAIRPRSVSRRTALLGLGALALTAGATTAGVLLRSATRPGGTVRWIFTTTGAVSDVVCHGGTLYAASTDGTVRALDAATGRPHWAHHARPATSQSLLAAGDALYLTDDDGLTALDAATGRLRWETSSAGVAAASANTPVGSVIEQGRRVVAGFDPATGAIRWRYRNPSNELWWDAPPMVAAEGRIHVALASSMITLDGETGTVRAAREWPSTPCSWLAAAAGRVFAGRTGELDAIDAASGRPLWQHEVPTTATAPGVADDQRIYLVGPGRCSAWDAATAWQVWSVEQPSIEPSLGFTPTATLLGDTLYVGLARSGWTATELLVSAYASDSGKQRWTLPLDGLDGTFDRFTNLVAADNTVYFGTRSARIYAIGAVSADLDGFGVFVPGRLAAA